MWLARPVCDELLDRDRREELRERLRENELYTFTLNGFPYGVFHGSRVKESVYKPDWSEGARALYTADLATILADLLPEGIDGTISTVPVTYGEWADDETIRRAVSQIVKSATFLSDLEEDTGKTVRLAFEPEPDCLFDSVAGAIAFFEDRLLLDGMEHLHRSRGISSERAEVMLRRHLGVCLDTVHSAVVGEDPIEALSSCSRAGIDVLKIQLGAALGFHGSGEAARKALEPFADPVYLHQTRCISGRGESRHTDLHEALETLDDGASDICVHYHVPLVWVGRKLGSQGIEARGVVSPELLGRAIEGGVRHFEVEVYTLDLLPGRGRSKHDLLAAELAWAVAGLRRAHGG